MQDTWEYRPFLDNAISLPVGRQIPSPTTDSLILAMSLPLTQGQRILELGTATGANLLLHAARMQRAGHQLGAVVGVDIDQDFLAIARAAVEHNKLRCRFEALPVAQLDAKDLGEFDVVFANPPFFSKGTVGTRRGVWHHTEPQGLAEWIATAHQMLCQKGYAYFLLPASELAIALRALPKAHGEVTILPIQHLQGRPIKRMLMRWRKGVQTPSRICAPLCVRAEDGKTTPKLESILRTGASVEWL